MSMNFLLPVSSQHLYDNVDILIRLPFLFLIDCILNEHGYFTSFLPLDTSKKFLVDAMGVSNGQSQVYHINDGLSKINQTLLLRKFCLLKSFGKDFSTFIYTLLNGDPYFPDLRDCPHESVIIYILFFLPFLRSSIKLIVMFAAFVGCLLTTNQLNIMYTFVISVLTTLYSYITSGNLIESHLITKADAGIDNHTLLLYGIGQFFSGFIISRCLIDSSRYTTKLNLVLKIILFSTLQLPILFVCFDISTPILKRSPVLSVGLAVGMINMSVIENLEVLFTSWCGSIRNLKRHIELVGINGFVEQQWHRIKVPRLLRAYWLIKIGSLLIIAFFHDLTVEPTFIPNLANITETGNLSFWHFHHVKPSVYEVFNLTQEIVLGVGCENMLSVIGMTAIISGCSQFIVFCFAKFIGVADINDWQYGTVATILFFLLALQTGITYLDIAQRISRLYRNFYLMSTAMLHFVHNMVKDVMVSLSAGPYRSHWHWHLRALILCFFLILTPIVFLYLLWKNYTAHAWMLAITAFSVEVLFKVLFTLIIYIVFMIEACLDQYITITDIDEVVYYIKAVGNTIEFMFGVFLFFNGGYIFFFESGGIIRGIMMGLHAYFNIFMQAKNGFQILQNRRLSQKRINSMPSPPQALLEERNDVCAICYMELGSNARVTPCSHIFHAHCLRKWLHINTSCPMCHQPLFAKDTNAPLPVVPPPLEEEEDVFQDGDLVEHEEDVVRPEHFMHLD